MLSRLKMKAMGFEVQIRRMMYSKLKIVTTKVSMCHKVSLQRMLTEAVEPRSTMIMDSTMTPSMNQLQIPAAWLLAGSSRKS